jgi:hypothetical protein
MPSHSITSGLEVRATCGEPSLLDLFSSLIDPGFVKTLKGRSRRGILFYRRRLPMQARTWRRRRTAFYVFCPLQRFDTAKTLN